jgi:hypothetical protein
MLLAEDQRALRRHSTLAARPNAIASSPATSPTTASREPLPPSGSTPKISIQSRQTKLNVEIVAAMTEAPHSIQSRFLILRRSRLTIVRSLSPRVQPAQLLSPLLHLSRT